MVANIELDRLFNINNAVLSIPLRVRHPTPTGFDGDGATVHRPRVFIEDPAVNIDEAGSDRVVLRSLSVGIVMS